jgi:PAS domain S-box-containing protein
VETNKKEITSEILDSMSDGIISVNNTGEIIYANDAACAILELPAKNYVQQSLLSIFLDREDDKNDQISQLFIDVVQNKAQIKKQLVSYFSAQS